MLFNPFSLLAGAASFGFANALSISSTRTYDIAIDPQGSALLNGVSFQQDALTTFGNYQYITFYNETPKGYGSHYVNVGRRQISPSVGDWSYLTLTDYEQTTLDGHNTISMGISGDGKIHLSFDHHDVPLNYRVSNDGIATTIPAWSASLFGPVIHNLPGSDGPWTPLTYPRFETLANGDMLMEFRIGVSGAGDSYIHRYSSTTGQWSAGGKYLQGNDDNAYINGFNSVNGRLWVSWTVRETPDANTNHDLYFAYSDDDGVTWKNSAGTDVAKPVTFTADGILVYNISQNSQMVNSEGQFADSKGRFHMLMRDATTGTSQYYHYLRQTNGVWSKNAISSSNLSPPPLLGKRGKILLDASATNAIALLPDDVKGEIQLYSSTEAGSFLDWAQITTIPFTASEPLFDPVRLEQQGVLSVFVRQNGSYPLRKVQVWDFTLVV